MPSAPPSVFDQTQQQDNYNQDQKAQQVFRKLTGAHYFGDYGGLADVPSLSSCVWEYSHLQKDRQPIYCDYTPLVVNHSSPPFRRRWLLAPGGILAWLAANLRHGPRRPWTDLIDFNGAVWSQSAHIFNNLTQQRFWTGYIPRCRRSLGGVVWMNARGGPNTVSHLPAGPRQYTLSSVASPFIFGRKLPVPATCGMAEGRRERRDKNAIH